MSKQPDAIASDLLDRLPHELATSIQRHGVPGASVAVWMDGSLVEFSSGMANARTGVATTPDTIFQIGSITKSFTATLTMQLVERGKLRLDAPIGMYLPDLRLGDDDALRSITLRHLLAHTSGIDGDLLTDTGRDDNALARLTEALGCVRQLHRPGAWFSYCNLGYNILGRALEVASGQIWDDLLRESLLEPLGLGHTVTSADEALRHRVAIGHVPGVDGKPELVERPFAPRSNGPSGMTMACAARDLATFGRMHLDGGLSARGQRILAPASISAMRTLQVTNPFSHKYRGWGLGWMAFDDAVEKMFGHDGGAAGNCAFLRVLPAQRIVAALLVNAERGMPVYRDLFERRLHELAGIEVPPALTMPAHSSDLVDLALYGGTYQRHAQAIDLHRDGQRLRARLHGEYVGSSDVVFELAPLSRDRFVAAIAQAHVPVHFFDFDSVGRPRCLHASDRAFVRRDAA